MKDTKVWYGATDIGVPHFSSDIFWKTGFKAPDPFFVIEIRGRAYMLMSPLEIGRAKKEARADRILLIDSFLKQGEASVQGLTRFLKAYKIREITVPHGFAQGIARVLGKAFIVHDSGHSLCPERARKSPREVSEITGAQRATEDAMAAAVAFMRSCVIRGSLVYDGAHAVTSEILRQIIDDALWARGYLATGTIVACGSDASDPHYMGSGPVRAREPIVIDIFPMSLRTHYYADMTCTIFKGTPSDNLQKMYEAVRGAQEDAIKKIRPGEDGAAIHAGAREYLASHGYPTRIGKDSAEGFIHGLGHGVGIDIHEAPNLGTRGGVLEQGNIVTVEPGLYYKKARGNIPSVGIRIEDMVLVTKTGSQNLTRSPKDLVDVIIR